MAKDSRPTAHPVCRAVAKSRKRTRSACGSQLWQMSDDEVSSALLEATRLHAQVEALDRHAPTAAALAEGAISADHARVITDCVERLPEDLDDPSIPERAEKHLLHEALDLDPPSLAILAKHVLTVVAPEIGEERDARALEREEREARANAWLTMSPDGKGSYRGKFSIPTMQGAMLKKMLLAFAAPKHRAATKTEDQEQVERRPSPERMGDALCELIERLPADKLPKLGGLNASIIVLLDFTGLKSDIGRAVLETGEPISASLARRMACEAGLIPAVLGSRSELLDLGRTSRLFNGAQRLGMVIIQRVCTAAGCDWPAHLCHAHHDDSWFSGGKTNFDKARLLCPKHHARIHDPRFETTIHPDNQVTFHMRT